MKFKWIEDKRLIPESGKEERVWYVGDFNYHKIRIWHHEKYKEWVVSILKGYGSTSWNGSIKQLEKVKAQAEKIYQRELTRLYKELNQETDNE